MPVLGETELEAAAAALQAADAVLVPALDGGYCLLGLKAARTEAFQGIAWSTPVVFTQTTARLSEAGLKVSIIDPPLDDVDDLGSWMRARELPGLWPAE